ncbi:unnamed protein product [Arctogadus glacialis]
MRNNIVISGLEEDEKEDSTITEQKVKTFLKVSLKMPAADLAVMDFQRAHRFGKEKRKEKQKVKLVVDKLYVNNELYKDPTKIDWL